MTTHAVIHCPKPNHKRLRVQAFWEKDGARTPHGEAVILDHGSCTMQYVHGPYDTQPGRMVLEVSEVD